MASAKPAMQDSATAPITSEAALTVNKTVTDVGGDGAGGTADAVREDLPEPGELLVRAVAAVLIPRPVRVEEHEPRILSVADQDLVLAQISEAERGIFLALAIGFFGGLFPALSAARLPIATALREG